MMKQRSKRRVLSRRRGWVRLFVWGILISLLVFIFYELISWPRVSQLKRQNPKTTAFIELYRREQIRAGKKPKVFWRWKPYSQISRNLKRAVLVAEDINFFFHPGFDFQEFNNAWKEALEKRRFPRGASTISQQVAKNLWLSPSRNPLRKLKEAILTIQLERELSKRRILEIYLNIVEFGPGIYGAESASRYYFGKSASELSEEESAELAASLPNPKRWHPGSSSRAYRYRVRLIKQRMEKASFLNKYL